MIEPGTAGKHVIGEETTSSVVRAHARDRRDWLQKAPVCGALGTHQIAHAGVMTARLPYEVMRRRQGGVYFLACVAGEGRVLIDGRWQPCEAGYAVALPAFRTNAFRAIKGKDWQCVWVRYEQSEAQAPLLTSSSPVLAQFDGWPLYYAVSGLIAEAGGPAQPAAMFHWAELIHGAVLRFVTPWRQDDRLWKLWEEVAAQVGAEWSLERMAKSVHVSPEHLRRLCRAALGRSPMQHVIWLRMQRAARLLATTDMKIEAVANDVGYQNPFVFSNTFKKWIGWRPSEHRGKAQG